MPDQAIISAPAAKPLSLEDQILAVVRDLLLEQGKERLAQSASARSSFQNDLGFSSLDLVEIVVRCEARLEIEVPDEIAEQADTAAAWAKAIKEGSEGIQARSAYRIVPPTGDPVAIPTGAPDLVEVLRFHAEQAHGRVHLHLLAEGSGVGITCDQLLDSASQTARGLISLGLVRNDTVAILLPANADFFEAFFGVMLAGGIPVPIYPPPNALRIGEYVRKQIHILRRAGIRYLISFDQVRSVARLLRVNVPTLIDVATVADLRRFGMRTSARFPEPSRIALIQYTSGTTGDPKGAVLTHANVLANIRAIGQAVNAGPKDAVVSWLPMSSDMGLVGCWLFSLYHGTPLTLLSPLEFLERPEIWLWAIHDSRGTLSAAPNFAYDLCARRIPMWTLDGIDLSSWRLAINAGERVMPETVERFTGRFVPLGFRPEAMTPAYGLSENTVALAISPLDRPPMARDGVYSVGKPLPGHEVRIDQGRLLFRGPSRCQGYYNEPDLPVEEWIDSGDTAFLHEGEIYSTGRSSDGNFPEPVERAVSAVPGVIADSVAAFETGKFVVVAETTAEGAAGLRRVEAAIHEAVARPIDEVRLIPPGTLPKTANLKIRRGEARRLFLEGTLGAEPSPPAAQMAGLVWDNLGALAARGAARLAQSADDALRRSLARAVAALGGTAPSVLTMLGRRPTPEGTAMQGPVVIVSQRCTKLDALSVVSLVQGPCVLAGDEALNGLPNWAARLLRPLLVHSQQEIESALKSGKTVILFPDSPIGTPVLRCRYRLRALDAAIAHGAPVIPFAMQIICNKLFFRVAEKIPTAGGNSRRLREQARIAIRDIYA